MSSEVPDKVTMIKITPKKLFAALILGTGLVSCIANAQGKPPPPGLVGKDGWLYLSYDMSTSSDQAANNITLDLIKRFNKVLAANGTTMVMILVPMKMRVYSEFLPPTVRTNPHMMEQYDRTLKVFRTNQIHAIDLNTPFLDKNKRTGPYPLYLKLDSHWSPSGVLLAAETIKAGIDSDPALKKALDATPVAVYKMDISKAKKTNNSHDLIALLPPSQQGQKSFPPEDSLQFKVTRAQGEKSDMPVKGVVPGISLLGSSNSRPWTGFSDALRFTLQRDILVSASNGDRGSWYGLASYMRSDAYQTKPPKLLFFEMSERDLRGPPNFANRIASYNIENTEWLLQVSALAQPSCKVSTVTAKIGSTGLAANAANLKGGGLTAGATSDTDFFDINFSAPVSKLDYLSAKIPGAQSNPITLEASGPEAATRKFTTEVTGDGALKYPLPSAGKGYTKVRIYPGKTAGFSFQGIQVCRQPEDLLS